MTQRRASKQPVDKGGWSVFHSTCAGSDIVNPAIHQYIQSNGAKAWFGWPDDPKLEALRADWLAAPAPEQKPLADKIQAEALDSLPYIPLGFYWQPSAWRKTVTGMFNCPVTAFWNLGKA